MPIKKENAGRYPRNWKEIRAAILARAESRCEWCGAENYHPHPVTGSKVVLTIAHLNHLPEDVRPENLAALCQRDHNQYDVEHRVANRRETLKQRRRAQQPVLFEV